MTDKALPAEQASAAQPRAGWGAPGGGPPGGPDWPRPVAGAAIALDDRASRDGSRALSRPGWRRALAKREATTMLAALALFLFLSLTARGFLRFDNLLDISRIFSLWCIVAVGETMLLVAKEVDLSVGSHYGFLVTMLGFLAATSGWNPWLAALAILALGGAIGLLNGLIVTRVGIQSFIVTLGGYAILRGGMILISGGYPVEVRTGSALFEELTGGRIFDVVPWMSAWMLLIVVVGWAVLRYTTFGYHLYATGGNPDSARHLGIRTDRVKVVCFVVTGVLCGLIAIITVGWLENAPFATGGGFELQVIAATFIGGTALTGGRGSLIGTLFGAAILGMIVNGLTRLGLGPEWEGLATGAVILGVAGVELLLRRRGRR